ncbi:hypothetical protein GCWU000182_00797 [Abiotrophia defectiva ATCC 49176]|uniref:Uncharacterized protein n=1 Tax=Abiotrophia defectiva ATCC 49176 TaxID=592010 RepID=W1Q3I5_ABIDE|nr:hypothetical protein GCWU000182_00797 [Abiotrophia defectiva ATCC 49176]
MTWRTSSLRSLAKVPSIVPSRPLKCKPGGLSLHNSNLAVTKKG